MAWIELHQSLPGHRKIMRIRRTLKIGQAQAVGHLCMLWLWCLDSCPDGDLSDLMDCEIAEAAGYDGKKPEGFVSALLDVGFLDADRRIHDWWEYAGKLIDKREKDAERKRTSRSTKRESVADIQRTSNGHPTDIQRMSSVTVPNTTVPNTTVPNTTVPNPTVPNHYDDDDRARARLAEMGIGVSETAAGELAAIMARGAGEELVVRAAQAAIDNGAPKWSYVRAVLERWVSAGLLTAEAVEQGEQHRRDQRGEHRRACGPCDRGDPSEIPDRAEIERLKAVMSVSGDRVGQG